MYLKDNLQTDEMYGSMQEPSSKKICAVSNVTTLVSASSGPTKKGILVQVCEMLTCIIIKRCVVVLFMFFFIFCVFVETSMKGCTCIF